jgi:hypothetical protein
MTAIDLHHDLFYKEDEQSDSGQKWEKPFTILRDYLQPQSSLSIDEAIDKIASLPPPADGKLLPMFALTVELGRQIPYDSPAQAKLAKLFMAYARSEKWLAQSQHKDNPELARNLFWEELNIYLHDQRVAPKHLHSYGEDVMQYVNLMAQIANLFVYASPKHDLYYVPGFAMEAMGDAFDLLLVEHERSVGDAYVMGAAQYVKWAAPAFWDLVRRPGDFEAALAQRMERYGAEKEGHKNGGLLGKYRENRRAKKQKAQEAYVNDDLKGHKPITEGQWNSWKQGFRNAACDELFYGEACRRLAGEAADIMALHQKSAD